MKIFHHIQVRNECTELRSAIAIGATPVCPATSVPKVTRDRRTERAESASARPEVGPATRKPDGAPIVQETLQVITSIPPY